MSVKEIMPRARLRGILETLLFEVIERDLGGLHAQQSIQSLVSLLHLIEEQAVGAALLQALHAPVFYARDCAYPGGIYSCFSRETVYGAGTE
jgi:hypothetical protein